MPKHREENVRRVLPIGSENVRHRLDLQAGEGTSAQPDPPVRRPRVHARVPAPHPESGPIQTTPQKHHGVLRGIRRRMGGWSQLNIDGYITQMQVERDQDEVPRVHDECSSEDDITPDEDSGDEYLTPGATGGGERESDLDFSGFSAYEEEEAAELYEPDPDSDSDRESEGDGPVQQRGRGVVCGVVPVGEVEVEVVLPLLLVVIVTKGGRRIPPFP